MACGKKWCVKLDLYFCESNLNILKNNIENISGNNKLIQI